MARASSGQQQTDIENLRAEIQRLQATEALRQCIFSYARAVDRLDRALLAAQFWNDARVDYGAFYKGPIAGFLDVAMRFQGAMRDTQHLIGNITIQVQGDRAFTESYVHAQHTLVQDERLSQLIVGARYLDRFERRGTEWRLSFRTEVMDWGRLLPIPERWFDESSELPKGARGTADLSYLIADFSQQLFE